MDQNIEKRLGQLAGLLSKLSPSLWSIQDVIEDGTVEEEAQALSVLRRACAAIDSLTRNAVAQFSTGSNYQLAQVSVPTLTKGCPIANRPGMSLLPAPSNPAVERWQRIADPKRQPHPVIATPETIAAGHNAVVVKPSSDYEAFLAKQLAPGTRKSYAAAMRHFIKAAGLASEEELLTVGPEMLIAYRNALFEPSVVITRPRYGERVVRRASSQFHPPPTRRYATISRRREGRKRRAQVHFLLPWGTRRVSPAASLAATSGTSFASTLSRLALTQR